MATESFVGLTSDRFINSCKITSELKSVRKSFHKNIFNWDNTLKVVKLLEMKFTAWHTIFFYLQCMVQAVATKLNQWNTIIKRNQSAKRNLRLEEIVRMSQILFSKVAYLHFHPNVIMKKKKKKNFSPCYVEKKMFMENFWKNYNTKNSDFCHF